MASAKKVTSKDIAPEELENDLLETDDVEQDNDETSAEDIDQKRKEAEAEIKKQLEAKTTDKQRNYYSEEELNARIKAAVGLAITEMKAGQADEDSEKDIYDPSKPRVHELTIPRYENKFIVAFGNLNKDEYNPDLVIKSIDMTNTNKETGTISKEPWVEVVFDDGERKMFPLNFIYKNTAKVACEIVEKKEEDVSYDFGVIPEKTISDENGQIGYGMKAKGTYIRAKVIQKKISFVVKEPRGALITVEPDVVNWTQVKTRR